MYYQWDVQTIYGVAPRYTDEFNIPSTTLPGTYQSIENPSLDLVSKGSTVLLFPVVNSVGMVESPYGGSASPVSSLPIGQIAPSVYVMRPVTQNQVPAGARVEAVMIGALPAWAVIVVIAILVSGATIILAGPSMLRWWAEIEYQKSQQAYYDTLSRAMEVVGEETVDIDSDGIADYKVLTYGNGKVLAIALTEAGSNYLGGATKVLEEGTSFEPPTPPPQPWDIYTVLVIGIAVAGVVLVLSFLRPKAKTKES